VLAGIAPAIAAIASLNAALFGSPLVSGYGELRDLYSVRYLWPNITRFASWIAQTDTPIVVLAGLLFVRPRLIAPIRAPFPRVLLGVFVAVVIASYLFYLPFDAWWFLRFLLPAWPVVMVLTAAGIHAMVRLIVERRATVALTAIVLAVAAHGVVAAANRSAFILWFGESRYIDVARYLSVSTEPNAVFITWQHTGSIRVYADRLTLHFQRLDRRWLDRAVARLRANGRHPYIVLDAGEVEAFRERFRAGNRLGALDWTPRAVFDDSLVVVFDSDIDSAAPGPARIASSFGQSARDCAAPLVWPPRLRWQ
jgi:hypothetical protein